MHTCKTKEFSNFKNEKILPDYFIIFSTLLCLSDIRLRISCNLFYRNEYLRFIVLCTHCMVELGGIENLDPRYIIRNWYKKCN